MPLAPFQVKEDTDIVDCAAVVEINTHISLVVGSLAAAIAATVQWSLALMLVEDRRRIPTMLVTVVVVIFFAGGEDVVHSSSALGGSGDGTR